MTICMGLTDSLRHLITSAAVKGRAVPPLGDSRTMGRSSWLAWPWLFLSGWHFQVPMCLCVWVHVALCVQTQGVCHVEAGGFRFPLCEHQSSWSHPPFLPCTLTSSMSACSGLAGAGCSCARSIPAPFLRPLI